MDPGEERNLSDKEKAAGCSRYLNPGDRFSNLFVHAGTTEMPLMSDPY